MKEGIDLIKNNMSTIISNLIGNLGPWMQLFVLVALCLIVLFVFFKLANLVCVKSEWFYKFAGTQLLADLIAQSLSMAIKALAIVITLYILGAESIVGVVIGTAGILGLGISFAFKDIIENYIAGIILSIRQPFKKSDHIIVDSHEGIVLRMTTRMTMIKSFDGNNISIPNATIFKSSIINFSVIPERRFQFTIGVNPEGDANFARKVGLNALSNLEGILADPSPLSQIDSIGDSSIVLSFYGWVNQELSDYFQVRSLAISCVKEAIENEGIEIPDPSYVIKIKNIENNSENKDKINKEKEKKSFSELDHFISPKTKEADVTKKQAMKESGPIDLLDRKNPE
jgi:small-conductance mechanosensitive channel